MSELLEWAKWYKKDLGWEVFPVFGVEDGVCLCRDGGDCSRPGKHPMVSGWAEKPMTLTEIELHWLDHPLSNIGIHCRDLLVVDLDGEQGIESFRKWREHYNQRAPMTTTSKTGGGGYHLYFKGVEGAKNAAGILPNVDIRAKSGYVIAPPSRTKKGDYEWVENRNPGEVLEAEVPPFVKEKLQKKREVPACPREPYEIDLSAEPGAEKGGRNAHLCRITGKVFAAKTGNNSEPRAKHCDSVLELMREFNKSKLVPPLPNREVERVVRALARC